MLSTKSNRNLIHSSSFLSIQVPTSSEETPAHDIDSKTIDRNNTSSFNDTMTTSVTLNEYQPSADDIVSAAVSPATVTDQSTDTPSNAGGLPESVSWRVTHSWELVSSKIEKVGIDFFLRVFEERPDMLNLFHFGGLNITRENIPPALKNHAMIVMKAIGLCVGGLTALDSLIPTLRSLGEVHKTAGVLDEHYEVIFGHLMDAIAAELGPDEWDADMRDAWELVFRSLTGVMKNPNESLGFEPMEGWGAANAIASSFLCFFTPFRMAGFSGRNANVEKAFDVCSMFVIFIVALDMCSHWLSNQVRHRKMSGAGAVQKGAIRQRIDRIFFPLKFRYAKFIRSLRMDQWAHWPRTDAAILASFAIQYLFWFLLGQPESGHAGVHWTFAIGLVRLVAARRLLHFIQCAENNLMLRIRMEPDEREYLRVFKLMGIMLAVIHVAACVWNIVARIELGINTAEPEESSFYPNTSLLMGGSGIFNSYLHSVHWAWVNLAGIGDIDSDPATSLECLTILLVHICGATLYAITTGNVVAILEVLSEQQTSLGTDLADIGELMQTCHVSGEDQKRILQAYMMQNIIKTRGNNGGDDGESGDAGTTIPDAVDRLPAHIRLEVINHVRAEVIKRREPAFLHCGKEFIYAMCGRLTGKALLLPGDYLFKAGQNVKNQVVFVEKGKLEVVVNGAAIRMLQRGDVIGKRWLLNSTAHSDQEIAETTLRAHSAVTLSTGLDDHFEIAELRRRYENDFWSLDTAREAINKKRRARTERQRISALKRHSSLASASSMSSNGSGGGPVAPNSTMRRAPSIAVVALEETDEPDRVASESSSGSDETDAVTTGESKKCQ